MAIVWNFDLLEGNSGDLTIAGWSIDMIGVATGYTGPAEGNIYAAITDPSTGCPQIGAQHPRNPQALLRRIQIVAFTPEDVRALFQYRDVFSVANLSVGATLNQSETNTDFAGGLIGVEYTYPDDYLLDPSLAGKTVKQGGLIAKDLPTMSRRYVIKSTINPEQLAADFVGKCNSVVWKGFPIYSWRCDSITGDSADFGITWTTTLIFQYKRGNPQPGNPGQFEGWGERAYFIDPQTGKPPDDLEEGVGVRNVDTYEQIDFNQLGI